MLQNATVSGNQHPDFLTSLMTMSLGLRLPRKMHLCRSSSNVPRLPSFLEMLQNPHVLLTFEKVHNPLRLSRETTSERPKVLRTPQLFALLASKCASRHNSVHFFNIATSKSGPNMVCVVHFDLAMCFARQRRALFRHLNFQKWSGPGVLCTFWLRNVLCTTTAVTFSTSQLPKVVRLTSKCASRHNGVQFFIAHLVSWLRTRRFSEPTFRPSEPQIIAKTKCFATLLPFRTPGSSFFWIFFLLRLSLFWSSFFFSSLLSSSLLFSLLLFSSLLFSSRLVSSRLVSSLLFSSLLFFDSYHLCFSSVHTVGSLTSKLPSIILYVHCISIFNRDGLPIHQRCQDTKDEACSCQEMQYVSCINAEPNATGCRWRTKSPTSMELSWCQSPSTGSKAWGIPHFWANQQSLAKQTAVVVGNCGL